MSDQRAQEPDCMEDEIDEAIVLYGNIHAPKPQGVLTGKTIFARDIAPATVVKVLRDGEEVLAPATHVQFERGLLK